MSNQAWIWVVLILIAIAVLGYLALHSRARGSGPPNRGAAEALAPPPAPPPAPGGPPATGTPADEPDSGAVRPGPYRGSALPTADGSFPSEAFRVKADDTLKRYVTPGSPYYLYAHADLWFHSAADAEAAGFAPWNPSAG